MIFEPTALDWKLAGLTFLAGGFYADVRRRLGRIEKAMDNGVNVATKTFDEFKAAIEKRVDRLEDRGAR